MDWKLTLSVWAGTGTDFLRSLSIGNRSKCVICNCELVRGNDNTNIGVTMTSPMTFLRSNNYDVCLAKGKIWTVAEAADYLAAYLANKESWATGEEASDGFKNIRGRLIKAMKQDFEEGRLAINEEYLEMYDREASDCNYNIDIDKSTIRPFIFITWALASDIEVPHEFAQYVELKRINKLAYYESIGLKNTTIHHERCRAIAELLWSLNPDMPIAVMARRQELIEYGCEGHEYDMRTISRWLFSLKTDRKPGQPRKNMNREETPPRLTKGHISRKFEDCTKGAMLG